MKESREEQILYLLGWTFIVVLSIFVLLSVFSPRLRSFVSRPCVFHSVTGLYCPGCGGTRSIQFLLRGKIMKSVVYHPFVVYGGGFFLSFMVSHTLHRMTRGRIRGLRYRDRYVYVGVALVVMNLIIKNLFLIRGVNLLK